MIEVKNLYKNYGSCTAASDVSFSVGSGEIVGFLGPNGAGKSTVMNIITGYLSSTSGEVTVDGIDMLECPMEAKRLIGYLPEQPPLYLDMTVNEYLSFVYELKKCTLPKTEHLREIRTMTKTEDVRRRLIKNLSKGYRQRVGIAEALIGDPPLVIFDEPTVGLDPKQIIEIRNLIRNLGKKHTVILSTHILSEAQSVCDRIIIINEGRIIADKPSDKLGEVMDDAPRYRYKICGPQRDVIRVLRDIPGVVSVEATGEHELDSYTYIVESQRGIDIRKPVFNAMSKSERAIIGVESVGVSLEEAFVRITDKNSR